MSCSSTSSHSFRPNYIEKNFRGDVRRADPPQFQTNSKFFVRKVHQFVMVVPPCCLLNHPCRFIYYFNQFELIEVDRPYENHLCILIKLGTIFFLPFALTILIKQNQMSAVLSYDVFLVHVLKKNNPTPNLNELVKTPHQTRD